MEVPIGLPIPIDVWKKMQEDAKKVKVKNGGVAQEDPAEVAKRKQKSNRLPGYWRAGRTLNPSLQGSIP